MTSRDFVMNDRDFHDDRSRFYYERLRYSWWQVEIIFFVPGITQGNKDAVWV